MAKEDSKKTQIMSALCPYSTGKGVSSYYLKRFCKHCNLRGGVRFRKGKEGLCKKYVDYLEAKRKKKNYQK